MVGGQWSADPEEDFSILKPGDDFPPARLFSLTVNVVVSRVESNRSLWCAAAVPMQVAAAGKLAFSSSSWGLWQSASLSKTTGKLLRGWLAMEERQTC